MRLFRPGSQVHWTSNHSRVYKSSHKPSEKRNCHFLWHAFLDQDIIHGKLEVMPPHHCRGSNYLQLPSFWSTVKIQCFSWLHSSAENSGGISLLLFFRFRGKMWSLRKPIPCVTTAVSLQYSNLDLLQTLAGVS